MRRLVAVEAVKLIHRPRAYLGYAGILLLLAPMILGLRYGDPMEHLRRQVGPGFEVLGSFINGLFLSRMALRAGLWFFLPLFVALVAGDLVAGEAAEGTLRSLLVRPVGRVPVLLAKFVVAVLHSAALTLFLGLSSLGLGALFFGLGDLFVFEEGIYVIPMAQALPRIAAAHAAGALSMVTVASLALLLSTLVDNSNGAIIATIMLLFVAVTVGEIPYFEYLRPYLFTSHMNLWGGFFEKQIPWGDIARSGAWLAGYAAACLAVALLVFRRKDILT